MLKKILPLLLISCCTALAAQSLMPQTSIIDVPTARTLDKYQVSLTTRAYARGTVMESADFGVLPQVDLGVSLAVYELVGSSEDIKILDPDFQAKWKLFDGDLYFPALAIGYDGRRYGYHRYTKSYTDDRKGGYLTFSREIFVPGLEATAGMNISDFDHHDIFFFMGLSLPVNSWLTLLGEWDNINKISESRANAGLQFSITPSLALSGAVRRIGRGHENERILQLRYTTNF